VKHSKIKLFLFFLILFSIIKLVVGYPCHHQDADHYYYWSVFLGKNGFNHFYEWGIPNAMPPTYPPVIYYVLYLNRKLYQFIHDFVWYFHLRIALYPVRRNTSLLIPWLETKTAAIWFNKIPAIIADCINAIFIYQIALLLSKTKHPKIPLILGIIFILSPPVWYSSAIWGQTDSLYLMFLLISLKYLIQQHLLISMIFLLISILTKPTAAYAAPVFLYFFWKKGNWQIWLKGFLWSLILVFFIYLPFDQSGNFLWIIPFFKSSLSGELNQMVANAFNFWALLFGFDNRPDFSLFFGKPLYFWGYFFYLFFSLLILILLVRRKMDNYSLILSGFLFSFLAFLVLPRVHERYFYPTLIFSILLCVFSKGWLVISLLLSMIYFLNLYHFWWVPWFEPLVSFLSNMTIIRIVVLVEIFIFLYGLVRLTFLRSK